MSRSIKIWLLAVMMAVSAWAYFRFVLIPYEKRDASTHDRPRGNLSDLYPRWLGARELLLHGRDPYSPEITREIQQGYYGRVLDPSRPGDPQDQAAFAYPVYVVFLIAPTVRLPFGQVQWIFTALLWIIAAISVLLWLRVLRWKSDWRIKFSIVILTLGSLPVIQAAKLQQLTLVVAGLLAGSFAAIASGFLALGGMLLAFATIKPQLALLPVLWVLAWSMFRSRQRWRVAASFSVVMMALLIGAQLILPGWFGRFLVAIQDYHAYTHNESLLQLLSTPSSGNVLAAVLVFLTAWLSRNAARERADSAEFATFTALILALVVVTVPMFALYNQILLLPALLVLSINWPKTRENRINRLLYGITAFLLFWPWIASLGLDLALLLFPENRVQDQWKLPFFTSFTLPIFVFLTLASVVRSGLSLERE